MKILGNIVSPERTGFGEIECRGEKISAIHFSEEVRNDEPWILPGFIEMHLHGCGNYSVENGIEGIRGMSDFLVTKGVSRFLPTYSCAPCAEILEFTKMIRETKKTTMSGAILEGSHLEGPWLAPEFCGGMVPEMIQSPDLKWARRFLDAAQGSLKMMTLAPELPGALEVIRLLRDHGVIVSCGHSACPPDFLETAVEAGISEICHLFDCYELPEDHGGVRQPALTDLVLIRDDLMKEIIMDGLHVPPELVIFSRRAAGAEHLIAITDAMQGAGLPEGRFFDCGKAYLVREGELARREEDGTIVGSSLTMNRAFFNMTTRFGFTPQEAVLVLSTNAARQLHIDHFTGSLQAGLNADITVLAPDGLNVLATCIGGIRVYAQERK